jgi:hypothetical protein
MQNKMMKILMISVIAIVSAIREPITSSYLRELSVQVQNQHFDARIDEIIENVIAAASSNLTKYTTMIRFLPWVKSDTSPNAIDRIAAKPNDIIPRLQEILIDSKITIIPTLTYCNNEERAWRNTHPACKELIIEW